MNKMDMTLIENRLDLINRYNQSAGLPCSSVDNHQARFIEGSMDVDEVTAYVRMCEYFIDAMKPVGLGD